MQPRNPKQASCLPDLPLRKESGDCAWLLEIRQLMYEYSSTQYPLLSVMKAKADLMSCKQEMNQTMEYYLPSS